MDTICTSPNINLQFRFKCISKKRECWFCQSKCKDFVAICNNCEIKIHDNIQNKKIKMNLNK